MDCRRGSHTKYKIKFQFVWVTKYRYQALQATLLCEFVHLRAKYAIDLKSKLFGKY
jgi:REP element-mobilizing transposase RayT